MQTDSLRKEKTAVKSVKKYQQILSTLGFTIIEGTYLNPLPDVWSITINDSDCQVLCANGAGICKISALANALSKFLEKITSICFWSTWYLGSDIAQRKHILSPQEKCFDKTNDGSWPDGVLNTQLQEFYNPNKELNTNCLTDVFSSNQDQGIRCIPFKCQRTDELVNFPINLISNLYSDNGQSIANNFEEARVNALSEIMTNFVKFKVISEAISLPIIPDNIISRYPKLHENLQKLNASEFTLLIQDASLNGEYPVILMSLINPQDQTVYCSFGGHPCFQIALERCLITLLNNDDLNQKNEFSTLGFDMDEIASPENLGAHFKQTKGVIAWKSFSNKTDYEFFDWDRQESYIDNKETFDELCNVIYQNGNDIFIHEQQQFGVCVCRILIPGISDIYPSDNLIWENNNAGNNIRAQILKPNKTTNDCETLIEELEELNLEDEHLISDLICVPSDTDSIFHDLCVMELVTLLALKTQDNERIQEGCEWLIHFKQLNPKRLKTYLCINTILQLNTMTNYGTALSNIYTKEILSDALALIDGEDIFSLSSEWINHKKLINAYKKIAEA